MPDETVVEIMMPQLGVSVVEGTIIAWRKHPGDQVEADEAVCDVATDKIDSELPAPCRGRIAELLVDEGETVDVGTVIATMHADSAAAPPPATAPSAEPQPAPAAPAPRSAERPRHSPVVLKLAAEHGVDVERLTGTGLGGRVRKEDVLAAAPPRAAPAGERGYVAPPPSERSRMRLLIGEHMKRSLATAATVTSWIEVDFGAIEARRRELGITALPIVARATAATLVDYGDLNAWIDGEDYIRHAEVNLGIAVSLGDDGLIVPVLQGAQRDDAAELARRITDVAARARAGTLSPDELRDGTFTISNPGQFGTLMATPVINQPQVAILDVEAIVRRPVVVGDEIAIRPICILGLSWDHRALDGVYAARFLAALRERLEAAT
jgi:2-oxoglutarate dehydrogenase E2 component (dihydrolipoamide succinyltransferase)